MATAAAVMATLLWGCSGAAAYDFSGWQARGPGDITVNINRAIHLEYHSGAFQTIDLIAPEPIPLPSGTSRVRFWYARAKGDFDILPIFRTANGRERIVESLTSQPSFPAIRRSHMADWPIWKQAESEYISLPADMEGRLMPEGLAYLKKRATARPYTLIGFRIRPARKPRDNEAYYDKENIAAGRGDLWITDLDWIDYDGFQAEYNWYMSDRWRWGWNTKPVCFLDGLTRKRGKISYSVELCKGFQQPVIWRAEGEQAIDTGDPMALYDNRIVFPELPPGRYYYVTKTWRENGTFDTSRFHEMIVINGKSATLPAVTPAMGWSTGQPDHVFPSDTAAATIQLDVASEVWHRVGKGARCAVTITDWRGNPILEKEYPRADAIRVECAGLKDGVDYIATADIIKGRRVMDRAWLNFGVANAVRKVDPSMIPASIPVRDETLLSRKTTAIAEHMGAMLGTEMDSEIIPQVTTPDELREFDRFLEQAKDRDFKIVSTHFAWGEIEPLPGVYRFDEIEKRVAMAAKQGMSVLLTPAAWGSRYEQPRWLEYDPTLDQYGNIAVAYRNPNPQPSFWDKGFAAAYEKWLTAVATRFIDNPDVLGYRLKAYLYDAVNNPEMRRADYSKTAREAYRQWQVGQGMKPLEPARPIQVDNMSIQRGGPDISPQWRRFFMDFRAHTYVEGIKLLMTTLRAVDPRRQLHIYRGAISVAPEAAIPLLKDGAEFHDEGGPSYFQRTMESMCMQAGIPYTNEGHQFTPPSKAMADAGFFYGSIYDYGWSWLYRWDADRHKEQRFAALPRVLEFVEESMPALSEWISGAGTKPQVLVFGSRADQLLNNSFLGHYESITGAETFTALFSYHNVMAHFADEYTDWVDPKEFNVVFAVGDVMVRQAIDRLAAYADGGGKLVLVGDAGKYCPEHPEQRDLLAKSVAAAPNVRTIPFPDAEAPEPGAASRWRGDFADAQALEAILAWAGVKRDVWAETPGFECVKKVSPDGKTVYVAVYRRYPENYENIWYDDKVEEKWGRQAARVVVDGMGDGIWNVEKFHRTASEGKPIKAVADRALLETEPSMVSELQLYRLTPLTR